MIQNRVDQHDQQNGQVGGTIVGQDARQGGVEIGKVLATKGEGGGRLIISQDYQL